MPEARHIAKPTPYASCVDFRRIFDEDMNELYVLSFLLTADHETAERCFVSGLDSAIRGNPVFKEWARSWARRTVILSATRVIQPRPKEQNGWSNSVSVTTSNRTLPVEHKVEIAAVLALDPFERFVYVMTVLERYSDQDCAVLLGCTRRDVLAARARTLQQLGMTTEMNSSSLTNASSQDPVLHERRNSLLKLLVAPPLVTSA